MLSWQSPTAFFTQMKKVKNILVTFLTISISWPDESLNTFYGETRCFIAVKLLQKVRDRVITINLRWLNAIFNWLQSDSSLLTHIVVSINDYFWHKSTFFLDIDRVSKLSCVDFNTYFPLTRLGRYNYHGPENSVKVDRHCQNLLF